MSSASASPTVKASTVDSNGRSSTYLFIGEYKYWVMTPCAEMDFDSGDDYIINRARLYRDRRDFVVE